MEHCEQVALADVIHNHRILCVADLISYYTMQMRISGVVPPMTQHFGTSANF